MGILNRAEILSKIEEKSYDKKLMVTPLLSEKQIGPASVDVRLGSSIIIPKKTYVDCQDVTQSASVPQAERRLYDRVRLRYHSKFILHPRQLILGVTLEYLALPYDIFATIMSRSSWGRLGLVAATASAIQPGFKGSLTLELVNVGESPIALYPGLPIGQLVFHHVPAKGGPPEKYEGRYDCPTEAGLPQFFAQGTDDELRFWGESRGE